MAQNKFKSLVLIVFMINANYTFGQSNVPTRDPAFYCECDGNGTDPSPAPYNRYKHYRYDGAGDEVLVANFCNYIEFSPIFKVAADGDSSYIDIEPKCLLPNPFAFLDDPNFDINEFNNGDVDTYGKLTVIFRDNTKLSLKYNHPKSPPLVGKYTSTFPSLGLYGCEIQIYNLPVVMIHGLWADRSSFREMEYYLINTGRYDQSQLYRADYQSTNDREFSHNFDVPRIAIDQALGQSLKEFMAVTKVNLVSHSMGGLLARQFFQAVQYPFYNNIAKIITCNTPHQGSQMANWLLDTGSAAGTKAKGLLAELGMSSTKGAVEDLGVTSSEIAKIQNGSLNRAGQVCSISTVQNHQVSIPSNISSINIFTYIAAQLATVCLNNYLGDIFDSPDSDLVVALESQTGGLTGQNTDVYNNQKHTGSVANAQVMAAVEGKLIQPLNSPLFAPNYQPEMLGYMLNNNCLFESKPIKEAKVAAASIIISSPTINENILAGNNIIVNFTSTEVDSIVAFLPKSDKDYFYKKIKATNNTLTIPTDIKLLGTVKLVLLGYSTTNELVTTSTVTINQTTNGILEGIGVYPKSVHLHVGDSLALTITGFFNDGIDRDITKDSQIRYSFLNNTATNVGPVIKLNSTQNDTLVIDIEIPTGARLSKPLFIPVQVIINTLDQTQTPLPVSLLSFTGKPTEKGNLLTWKTANETNFSHFEIERSVNSNLFELIGNQKSKASENYEYRDSTPPPGAGGLYRLRLVDLDGKFSYSKIISIKNTEKIQPSGSWGAAYPNPFSNQISIENIGNKELKINLIDLTGREIIKPIISNQNKIELSTEKIEIGIYFLQVKEGEKVKIQKVIKQ